MFKLLKSLREETRGGVLAYTAIMMPIFLGFLALGIDVAAWHIEKRQSQNIADAAAVAAGAELIKQSTSDLSDAEIEVLYEAAALDIAEANGFDANRGQTMAVNSPPTLGESQGLVGAIEVIITSPLPVFLSGLVNVEEGNIASSRAVVAPGGGSFSDGCVYALNPDVDGAITVSGNATVTLGCAAYSNSVSDQSIIENGANACITASDIFIVGNTQDSCFSPAATTGAPPVSDPLGGLPEPENADDSCDFNNTKFNGQNGGTLNPGVYCGGISINTSQNVHFNPGVYIIKTGGITINGQADVTGDEMMIFIPSTNTDIIRVNGGANVSLSAPTDGDYQGILVYSSRDHDESLNTEHRFNGGSDMDLEGVIYTPGQDLQFTGNNQTGSEGTILISDQVTFSGTSDFTTSDDSNSSSNPFFGTGSGGLVLVE